MMRTGCGAVTPHPRDVKITLVLLGLVFVLASLFIALPVVVNFPESWPGALIGVAFLAVARALFYRAARITSPGSPRRGSRR